MRKHMFIYECNLKKGYPSQYDKNLFLLISTAYDRLMIDSCIAFPYGMSSEHA